MKNKYEVTITFPTKELLDEFCSWMSNQGEQYFMEDDPVRFDYTRCFPAWGWKEGEPKYIDVEICEEEE